MIVPLGFLETSAITASVVSKYRDALLETGALPLRGPATGDPAADCLHIDLPLLEEWNSARSTLTRLRNAIGARLGKQAIFGKVALIALRAGEWAEWAIDRNPYADQYMRLHITLVPSENPRLFSGDATVAPGVGHVLCVDHRRPHSAVNLGNHWWIQLIVDVRRGDAPELPVDDPGGEPAEPVD